MRPIDKATGRKWSETNAIGMYKAIRAKVLTALLARDRANGIPEGGQVYSLGVQPGTDDSTKETGPQAGVFVIDRHLAELRHTGRDIRLLTNKKWYEFCEKPQDQKGFETMLTAEHNAIQTQERWLRTANAPDVDVEMPIPANAKSVVGFKANGTTKATGTAVADT